jgi:ABC-2 type transport system ATP-binding protein
MSELSATPAQPAISVHDLHMSYGSHEVLRGIDFEVAGNEVFGFLGPNGAGKSTTIEILEGYRRRSAGEVSVLGVDPARPTRAWRDRIGLVLQESELNPVLTVAETLTLYSRFYRSPRDVGGTIELVGLGPKGDSRVGALSGEERRRLDVAVALVGDPELLFLDEPTTGFDPAARRSAWSMIAGLRALGKTIFLTTHYMEEAQRLADRVAILRDGRIVAIGSPDRLSPGARTVISFKLPEGVPLDAVRATLSEPLEVAGDVVAIRSERPQHTLYELTSWAEREGIGLIGLEVSQPRLEDVYLELTGAGHG